MRFRQALTLVLFLIGAGFVAAKAPVPPSNLRVKPLGVNSFRLDWQDNSKNEKGWEIRVSLGVTDTPKRFLLVPSPDITSYVVLTNDVAGKTLSFQLAAYNGETGFEKISKPTSSVTVTALDSATFADPDKLTAKTLDDGSIRLAWKDHSTLEQGYQIQYRKGSGKWEAFGTTNPDVKFSLTGTGFEPTTRYSFRVRAFKSNPGAFTRFSNVATATTLAFRAPSQLAATAEGDGAISLKWKDRSSIEGGYEIESRSGSGVFSKLGEVAANVSSTDPITNVFTLNTDYQLRVRAFRTVNSVRVYTGYSNVASARTSFLNKPTGLAGTAVNDTSVRLTWNDASTREFGFQIQYRKVGTTGYTVGGFVAANVREYTVTGLTPGVAYDFRVGASELFTAPSYSAPVQVTTKGCAFDGDADPPIFWNSSFVYQIGVTNPSNVQLIEVTGLPTGLGYQASSRTISGTTTEEGVKTVTLKGTFKDGYAQTVTLTLRIVRPQAAPLVGATFAPVEVVAGNTASVSTTGKFTDPDTGDARRVTTTLGSFDIILYPLATPGTVSNFLQYADANRYDGTFFHRSVANFIVQGGGYGHDGSNFSKVAAFPAIQNEPGISNLAGTVAMAKIGGNPHSATSEFFVNVNDANAANLDVQNEGFTVFGRVAGTGMDVVNQINALPRKDYTVTVDGGSRILTDVPMNDTTAPALMDPAKLVKVTSVAAVPILRYEVVSANTAVATAAVNGSNVDITGVATGSTTITVKAFDLDGQMVSQTIPVTVP